MRNDQVAPALTEPAPYMTGDAARIDDATVFPAGVEAMVGLQVGEYVSTHTSQYERQQADTSPNTSNRE
jgi:hypothetical protein